MDRGRRRGARRRSGQRRRERRGEGAAASGRRGGDEDDGAVSRRLGSGVGRGEGKGIEGEGEGERGDRFGPGIGEGKGIEGEGTILMAHHPSVRHKYIHTNGAPHRGAPLVFFLFQLEPTGYVPPELIHIKSPLLARLVSSQFSHQDVLGSTPRLHKFFLAFKKLFDTYLCLNMFKLV